MGILVTAIIDYFIPEHAHECTLNTTFAKSVIMVAIAVAIHNFPEGFAIFIIAKEEPHFGISIAIAIAIDNIP